MAGRGPLIGTTVCQYIDHHVMVLGSFLTGYGLILGTTHFQAQLKHQLGDNGTRAHVQAAIFGARLQYITEHYTSYTSQRVLSMA